MGSKCCWRHISFASLGAGFESPRLHQSRRYRMKFCKTCNKSTYKPRQRIYTKYCNLVCRDADKDYWAAISKTKQKQVISADQKLKISNALRSYYKNNPKIKNSSASINAYRCACSFTFNLADYPTEFDFHLLEKYGWYKPSNKGDNLLGVSRDHAISVSYGFKHGIDPRIIAHPANCILMQQNKNSSKGYHSSMTIEQLMFKITLWDNKYNC